MREYQCDFCGRRFKTDQPEAEVEAETKRYFGDVRADECATVCDDCFKLMHPAEHPREVESAVAETIRKREEGAP